MSRSISRSIGYDSKTHVKQQDKIIGSYKIYRYALDYITLLKIDFIKLNQTKTKVIKFDLIVNI